MKMSSVFTLVRKEVRTYFRSPMAWILLGLFAGIMGFMSVAIILNYIDRSQGAQMYGAPQGLSDGLIRPVFGNLNVVLLFIVPFITMRLFAEERKNNTIELLVTAPITLGELVLGKFISAMAFVASLVVVTLPIICVLGMAAPLDWAVVGMAYLGTFLMISVYVALGLMSSSMTDNQLIAGGMTFFVILFLWIIRWITFNSSGNSAFNEIFSYLSIIDHYEDFSRGVFNSKDLVFFLSACFLGLFLTHKNLESYTWRS